MGRLTTFFITVFALFSLTSVNGQTTANYLNSGELTFIDINSPLIFSGEDLLYKVSIKSPNEKFSKIAYVTLIDESKKIWFQHKVAINNNGTGAGSYTIPAEAETGNYKLISYTSWSQNNEKSAYYSQDLVIINPFIPLEQGKFTSGRKDAYILEPKKPAAKDVSENGQIDIELNSTQFSTRDQVKFTIDPKTSEAASFKNFLVSVSQLSEAQTLQELPASSLNSNATNQTFLPEIKGELISGSLKTANKTKNSEPPLVALNIPGNNYVFKITQPTQTGQFTFLIDQPYSSAKSSLQVLDPRQDYKIVIDKKNPQFPENLNFKQVIIDPALENWITQQSIDLQIENAYKEPLVSTLEDSLQKLLFYDPFATRYTLDDYTRFPSMHQTFVEIIATAAMRIDADQTRLLVYNENQLTANELDNLDPLVLIDGIQIQDFSLVAALNPARVEYIDVVNQQYRYGPKIFSGIIAVSTKENDYKLPENSPNTVNFDLISPKKNSYFRLKNSQNSADFSRIPDYRTQLYWDPNMQITKMPRQITFYTSDKEGLFEIRLTSYKVSGEKIEVKKTFRVQAEK